MPETRHKTIIEVHADTSPAKRQIADLQTLLDRVTSAAAKVVVGGAAGGAAAGGAAGAPVGAGGGPGARPGQGKRDATPGAGSNQTLAGQMAGQLFQSFGGGIPGMVAGSGMMVQGALQAVGKQMQQSTNAFLRNIGQSFAGGLVGNVVGPMMSLMGAGVAARFQTAEQRARLTTTLNRAALTGVFKARGQTPGDIAIRTPTMAREAAERGFMPQEAAQIFETWGQAKGTTAGTGVGGDWRTALTVARTGVSLGTAAQYAGLAARGAGGRNVSVLRQIGMAQQQGMRGSGVDRWLQMIASNTQQMATSGFDLNLKDHDRFIRSILGTKGMEKSGYRAVQMAGQLGRTAMGARQQLLGGFAGMGQAAVLAKAAAGGGDIMGVLQGVEGLGRDPEKVRQAIIEMYGPEAAALFFAQKGAPAGMAKGLAGELGAPVGVGGVQTWQPSEADKTRAKLVAERIQEVGEEEANRLIEAQEKLTDALHELGSVFSDFLKWVQGQTSASAQQKFPTSSDARLKRDVSSLRGGLPEVLALRAKSFRWTDESGLDDGHRHFGFIAQEVMQALPGAIFEDGLGSLAIEDRAILATLVHAVQELHEEVRQLRKGAG